MIKVPDALWRKFERYLSAADVLRHEHGNYRKWLRFYLDFCSKYRYEYANADSIPPFLEKLASKRQDSIAREQAGKSVSIYHMMVRDADDKRRQTGSRPVCGQRGASEAADRPPNPPSSSGAAGSQAVQHSNHPRPSRLRRDRCLDGEVSGAAEPCQISTEAGSVSTVAGTPSDKLEDGLQAAEEGGVPIWCRRGR